MYKVNDLVITSYTNRWNLPCVGIIVNINDDGTYDVKVLNLGGPGADCLVHNILEKELKDAKTNLS